MSFEERMEALAARHDALTARHEALAMNLELMGHDLETQRAKSVEDGENIRALLATARQDGEDILRLRA